MRAGENKDVLDNPPKKEGIGGMLTNEQIQHFDQEGYLVFESLIQGEKLEGYTYLSLIFYRVSEIVPI